MLSSEPISSRYKWELLFLLCLAYFFHQGDRAIFGVVVSDLRIDLGLSDSQIGFTGTALFATLAVLMPFAGYAGDVFNRKWVITLALICWSAATLFTGMVTGMVGLVLLRSVATAGAETFYTPAAYSLLGHYHVRTRSLAMSIHQAALYIGVMVSGFLGGAIAEAWGWRWAFYIFGGTGILLGIVFIFRLKDTPRPSGSGVAATGEPPPSAFSALGKLFRVRTAMLLTIGFTAIVFVNNAYVVWAPELLRSKFNLSLTLAGGYALFFHHLLALIGVLAGGWLSDRWVVNRPVVRIEMQFVGMLLAIPAIVWMGLASDLVGTCCAMAVFGLFRGVCESNTHPSLFDVIEPRHRASAMAMRAMCAFLVGSFSPWILGVMRDSMAPGRGLSLGFAGLAGAYMIGAVAFIIAALFTFKRDRVVECTSG